jgi:hypothetical protein
MRSLQMNMIPNRYSDFIKQTILLSILLFIISSCNLPTEDVGNMDYGNPVDFWVVDAGEGYLCPDFVSDPSLPPTDPGAIEITNENVVRVSSNPNTGITRQYVDLDGDGQPDIVHRYDQNGNLIDKKGLDQGGVVSWGHHDEVTGYTWKWVDTDGDGKPNVKRRYDKLGDMKTEKFLPDTITGTMFDNSTGTTTEQIDTDRDGKPDLERKYDREGTLTSEESFNPGDPGTKNIDPITGVISESLDLDGDGIYETLRRKENDGTVIGDFPLDGGHIVVKSVTDTATGTETKYIDSNGDDVPDAARMYDKFGNKLTDRIIRGKLIKSELDEKTGELTEWIDMNGDGRPDVSRKFDYKGMQFEEKAVDPGDLGNAVGMSLDHSTGNSTIFVDENEDHTPDYVLICDPTGMLIALNDIDPNSSPTLIPIANKWPRYAKSLAQGYQNGEEIHVESPDPTAEQPASTPSEVPAPPLPSDAEQACAVFEEIEIQNLVVRHMRDCIPTLNFHYMMDGPVPGLVSESPIDLDYTAVVNGKPGNCFLEEDFDDRLYCRVDISANEAYTLGHFELFANPCQEPISVLDQTLPMLEGCEEHQTESEEYQTEPEEPECDS